MDLFEVYLNLSALYANNLLDNKPFFDKVSGNLRISVTHNQASILDMTCKTCVMMLKDVSRFKGEMIQHKIMFSEDHGNTSTSVEIANNNTNEFQFITDIPMYLPPGSSFRYPLWNIDEITEEFIFQQSTIHNLLEYKYFDQLKCYFSDICRLNVEAKTICSMHLDFDWHNIPLTENDFL